VQAFQSVLDSGAYADDGEHDVLADAEVITIVAGPPCTIVGAPESADRLQIGETAWLASSPKPARVRVAAVNEVPLRMGNQVGAQASMVPGSSSACRTETLTALT